MVHKISKTRRVLLTLVLLMFSGASAFSQDPGGSPDGPPPAVPFSDYVYAILIIAGALLSLMVFKRLKRKASM